MLSSPEMKSYLCFDSARECMNELIVVKSVVVSFVSKYACIFTG